MDAAITQIKDNPYLEALTDFSGVMILVGINYNKETKAHPCKIEKIDYQAKPAD